MSYEEVERGLPPVNEVNLVSSWRRPRPITTSTGTKLHPPFALTNIQPNGNGTESKGPNPKLVSRNNSNASTITLNHEHQRRESPLTVELNSSQSHNQKTTKRYVIKEDDDEMRVFKVIEFNSEHDENLSEIDHQQKLNKSNYSESWDDGKFGALTCRNLFNFLLLLLPVICFVIVLQFLKQLLSRHLVFSVPMIGVFIFQPIFCSGIILGIVQKFYGKLKLFGDAFEQKRVWIYVVQLISLGFLSSVGLLFQLVSLIYLDLSISVGMLFCPLIIASFINHINRTRKLSIELLVTSLLMYIGIVLISIPILLTPSDKRQEGMIIGVGCSVTSMMILIPSCLILINLRKYKVDDSMEILSFGFLGTINSILLGLFLCSGFQSNMSLVLLNDMSGLGMALIIVFTFLGTLSMYLESRFYRSTKNNSVEFEQEQSPWCWLKIGRARFLIFIILIFVELFKLAFEFRVDYFNSPFSFFGILAIIIGYIMTVAFEHWYHQISQQPNNNQNQTQESTVLSKPNSNISSRNVGKLTNWTPFEFLPWIFGIKKV